MAYMCWGNKMPTDSARWFKASLFPEDEARYLEARTQVVREVRAAYAKEADLWTASAYWASWHASSDRPDEDVLGGPAPESGWPWPVNEEPYRVQLGENFEISPDAWSSNPGFTTHSERVVNVIEQIEPGRHRHLPVDYYNPDGSYRERRWAFNCRARIDTIDLEHSPGITHRKGMTPNGHKIDYYDIDGRNVIKRGPELAMAVHADKIKNRAIWVEYRLRGGSLGCTAIFLLRRSRKLGLILGNIPHHFVSLGFSQKSDFR